MTVSFPSCPMMAPPRMMSRTLRAKSATRSRSSSLRTARTPVCKTKTGRLAIEANKILQTSSSLLPWVRRPPLMLRRLPRALKRLEHQILRAWQKLIQRLQRDLKPALLEASVGSSGVSGMAIALSPQVIWVRPALFDFWPVLEILRPMSSIFYM